MGLIKSNSEIRIMHEGGKILGEILFNITKLALSGMTTHQLDNRIDEMISDYKVKPAFKNFKGYPNASCISINRQVVHSIPNQTLISPGDLLSVDVGIIYKRYNLDSAITINLPPHNPEKKRLVEVTKNALVAGITAAIPGNTTNDIAKAVSNSAKLAGFNIIKGLTGHGIGLSLQEDPAVPNEPVNQKPVKLMPGMVIAIEPMLTDTNGEIETESDGWTIITKKPGISAHFEHTVAITQTGNIVLTERDS